VISAGVAETVLHLQAPTLDIGGSGRCACDIDGGRGAAEMAALYQEVYRTAPAVPLRRRIFGRGLKT
jgi:hypothetical protein